MEHWLNSIHSEVNKDFVSNPYTSLNEEIIIRLRILKNNNIEQIIFKNLNRWNKYKQNNAKRKRD